MRATSSLLGLTATPERADGGSILGWFDGRIAVELRLWEALERGLLAPFQYFGHHDETDLRTVRWKRGTGYDAGELTNVYRGHHARTRIVLQALLDKVTDVGRMRALGFCVSIDHAEFMADRFNKAGIPARAVKSRTSRDDRRAGLLALRNRDVNVLFTVDLFNEGVDVPEIDTVLFLRPHRKRDGLPAATRPKGSGSPTTSRAVAVLDFIGNQTTEFRFDPRYQALTGVSRRGLAAEINKGFPTLPPGCHIELDRVAADLVMRNVLSSLRIDWKGLVGELRQLPDADLSTFVAETGLELEDVYRRRRGGWAGLRRMAGLDDRPPGPDDEPLAGSIGRMLHVDDMERLAFISQLLSRAEPPSPSDATGRAARLFAMLHFSLWGWNDPLSQVDVGLERLWANPSRREELLELGGRPQSGVGR